jgi:hypothetical protein
VISSLDDALRAELVKVKLGKKGRRETEDVANSLALATGGAGHWTHGDSVPREPDLERSAAIFRPVGDNQALKAWLLFILAGLFFAQELRSARAVSLAALPRNRGWHAVRHN